MRDYFCYIHTAGSLTPELRVVCTDLRSLPDVLVLEMREWPQFEMLDVYDSADRQVLRVGVEDSARFRN
jgi:hypothetical protein